MYIVGNSDIYISCALHSFESESEVTHSCLTLWDPMDCSLPGASTHGIFQARILERVAISFSRGSSWPRDQTWVSCIADRFFTIWAIREALYVGVCIHTFTCVCKHMHTYIWESQFLVRLIRSPGFPMQRKGWSPQEGESCLGLSRRKGQMFFSTLLCLS